jgi:hypothetical protein
LRKKVSSVLFGTGWRRVTETVIIRTDSLGR